MKRLVVVGALAIGAAFAGSAAFAGQSEDTAARLDALQKEKAAIERENALLAEIKALREKNAALRSSTALSAPSAAQTTSRPVVQSAPKQSVVRVVQPQSATPAGVALASRPSVASGSTGALDKETDVFGAYAADLPVKYKSAVETPGVLNVWGGGGAFWTGGDGIPFGGDFSGIEGFALLGSLGGLVSDPIVKPNVGWSAVSGFDYRFAGSPWHINGQVRYGQSKGDQTAPPLTFSSVDTHNVFNPNNVDQPIVATETTTGLGNTAAGLRESHWLVDFGGGYDIPFARGAQVNFGIRTAEISSTLTTRSSFGFTTLDPLANVGPPDNDTTSLSVNFSSTDVQKSTFLGAGPRVGVSGSAPFLGNFSFDYSANAAYLIGRTRITDDSVGSLAVASLPVGNGTNFSESGITGGSTFEKYIGVFNTDVLAGFSYWFTPAMRLSVNYRLDAYFSGLRTFDANGNIVSLDRYYHGAELVLGAKF